MQLKPTQSGAQATPLASNTTTPAQSTAAPDVTLSQTETEELVKTQLAALLKSPVEQIQLVSTVARTWPDQGLGCGRKGLYEPLPTPGYELTLAHAGQTFRYHTDQQGRLIRCIEPGKPRGPISR